MCIWRQIHAICVCVCVCVPLAQKNVNLLQKPLDDGNTDIYILDTGVEDTHPEFEGRVSHLNETKNIVSLCFVCFFFCFFLYFFGVFPNKDINLKKNPKFLKTNKRIDHGTFVASLAAGFEFFNIFFILFYFFFL